MTRETQLPEFDALMSLYRNDPAAFEQLRKNLLRQAIDDAPLPQRPALEQLLDRIEATRAEAATPMDAVLGATRMMFDSVAELRGAWQLAHYELAGLQAALIIERLRRN